MIDDLSTYPLSLAIFYSAFGIVCAIFDSKPETIFCFAVAFVTCVMTVGEIHIIKRNRRQRERALAERLKECYERGKQLCEDKEADDE